MSLPTTPRLTFRRFTEADADLLVDLDSDPEVMRYINMGKPTPRNEVVNIILPRWLAMYEMTPGRGFFAAFLRADVSTPSQFLGWFHLKPGYCWPEQLEIGYRLRRPFWNRGYATEGTRALLDYAFAILGEPIVIATTMLANVASRRVMEKCGMVLECEFAEERWPDKDKRAVKYSIRVSGCGGACGE